MKPSPSSAAFGLIALGAALSLDPLQAQSTDALAAALAANGTLTFNLVPGYTNYTVEWAPTVNGPWNRSWDGLTGLQPAGSSHSVEIPMFFRVVARGSAVHVPSQMSYVGPGEFLMGDNFSLAADALPVRAVRLRAFLIDRLEVTKALWDEVRNWAVAHGYDLGASAYAAAADRPVSDITWYDAVKWCNARSEQEGLSPVYFTDAGHGTPYRVGIVDLDPASVAWETAGYRLPTEAEWEKAARGGLVGQHFPWPSEGPDYRILITGTKANYWNSGDRFDNGTSPAGYFDGHQAVDGQKMANGYSLYDMAGNVAEMCWDRAGAYDPLTVTDPRGPDTGGTRVLRGGSWYDAPIWLRCANRRSFSPATIASNRGFRCARSLP